LLENDLQQGVQRATHDLNMLYRNHAALYDLDFESGGFDWIDCHDNEQSIISYIRRARDGSFAIIVLNFTPVLRKGYRIGVPQAGHYRELFNSDASYYGGSNQGNGAGLNSENKAWMNQMQSLVVTIPPLGAVILELT
jgi:1,4-alpha-glucan branching enzyme